jgi:phosphatidylinositol phospholipase C delta
MTTRLPAHEAFTAIAKHAFVASPYPVILSLESHLSVPQQERLVEIMRSTLGKALLDQPLKGVDGLPSPHDLRYRILVKTKHRDLALNKATANAGSFDSDSEGEELEGLLNGQRTPSLLASRPSSPAPGPDSDFLLPSPAPSLLGSPRLSVASSRLGSPGLVRRATSPAVSGARSPQSPRGHSRLRGQSLSGLFAAAMDDKRGSALLEVPRDLTPSPTASPTRHSLSRRLSDLGSGGALSPDRRGSFRLGVPNALLSPTPSLSSPRLSLSRRRSDLEARKPKMSSELVALLIYTIGVKYQGAAQPAA